MAKKRTPATSAEAASELELRRQNVYLTALQETALGLVSRLELGELLQTILARAGELFDTRNGYVFLLDRETNEMVMRVGVGEYEHFVGTHARRGAALAGKVWESGEPVIVDDYRTWSERIADPSRDVLRAVVGVPLKSREEVVGILGLAHLDADKLFGPAEMDVLTRFAALASIALDNARLYEAAQHELVQRRATEARLRYERDLLQALMDNIPDLIFFKDRESRFVRSNNAHLRNLGATSMDQVFGKTDLDFHANAPAHGFLEDEQQILETGVPILNQVEANPAADGSQRFFSASKVAWRDQDGAIIGTLGVAHDITDRVLAEEKLKAEVAERQTTEQFLNSIIENLPTMLFAKEADELRFVRWNKSAEEITGMQGRDVLGKNDYDIVPPAEAEFFIAKDRETLTGAQVVEIPEEPIQAADGNIRWLHTKKFPVLDAEGKPAFLVGISEDITERRRSEQELRESEERYRDLFENANDLIQSIAADGHILYVNNAWKQALGFTDQEISKMRFLDFVHPDGRADAVEASARLLRGETLPNLSVEYRTKEGRKLLLEGSATPRTVNGQVTSTRSIFRDVTDRRDAELQATFQNALLTAQYQVSPDGILVVGNDDRILTYNSRFIEMWNIPPEALQFGTAEALRQAVRENLADVEGWIRQSGEIYMQQDKSSHDELAFKDGRILERFSAPIKTPEGAYLGRVWYFHDITESRRAEASLRRVVEGARAVFWRANVTKLNDETQEAFGYHWETQYSNPDAVLAFLPIKIAPGQEFGDAWYNSWVEEDRGLMDARSANALRKGLSGYTQEYRLRDVNGNIHWMHEDAQIQPLDETHFEIIGFSNDVTERKLNEDLVRRQNAYLNALQETSLGLMQRLDVNALLQDIVARAGALVGTESGYVFLVDPDGPEMELKFGVGAYEGFVGRRTKPGVGLAGQVWETNAPVSVDDYRQWEGRLTDTSRDILRAVVGVPLRSGEQVIGVIGLAYLDEARTFGTDEVQVLQRFAQLATIALDNARLYETAQEELGERTRAERALAQQLRETELLNRVTAHAVNLDVDRALTEICRDLGEYFQVPRAGIALLNDLQTELTIVAESESEQHASAVGSVIPLEGNLATQYVIAERMPLAITDAQHDPRVSSLHGLMRELGVASLMIAPLLVREQVIGTIGLDAYETREFGEHDRDLVQQVAVAVSQALANARLYQTAQKDLQERQRAEQQILQRNKELEVLSRVSAVMTTDIDLVTGLETMARELVAMFRARNCGIALLNPDKNSLTVVADALSEEHEEHAVGIIIPVENNPSTQYVLENRRSLIIPDAQTDPMTAPIHERMRQRRTTCLAIIPLLSGGEVIGTIGLDTTDPEHIFTDAEIRLAETMANQIANAIEKQRLFDQTRERAHREQVTREIGAKLGRSLDMDVILQTMARELSQALGASHAVVRMGESEMPGNGNGGNGHS